MPTFDNPAADAAEASESLRGLAHATRAIDAPADLYGVLGDLLGGVRSLQQVLEQLAVAHDAHRARARDDEGDVEAGARFVFIASSELFDAAKILDQVETALNLASQASGRIAWHPARGYSPTPESRTGMPPQSPTVVGIVAGPTLPPSCSSDTSRPSGGISSVQRERVQGSWFEHPGIAEVKRLRGLEL